MADDTGMDKSELRKLLTLAKKTPVSAAMGMGKDGTPVLLLHKTKHARALSKELEATTPDLKNMRWGELLVDEEKDPRTLIARLNKPSSGLARKLIKVVKFAGFSKVVLQFEDGSTEEGGDEEGVEDAAQDSGTPQSAAADTPAPPALDPVGAAPSAAPQAAEQDRGADLRPLTVRLTALVKRMIPLISADPSRQGELSTLAKTAQAAIQGGDQAGADKAATDLEKTIVRFETAKDAAPAGEPATADAATIAKARAVWLATRKRVDADLNKLLDTIRDTYKDHGGLAEIEKHVQGQLDTVLDALDEDLAHKLDEMSKATGPERPKLVAEAKKIVARYQQHIATDKVVGTLDDNPFVPISVQKTVSAALSALSRSIH